MTQNTTTHPASDSPWLTPGMAAREAHVGRRRIYTEVRRRRLRAARIGGRKEIRINRTWLYEWLESLAER